MMTSRKGIGHKLLMVDVKFDKSSRPEVIKDVLGKYGYGNGIEDVKWYINKWTKKEEDHCIIIFKNINFASAAREGLNGQLVLGIEPVKKFTLIPYPPTSEEEKLLFARHCCHGLVLSGYDPNSGIDHSLIKKEILRYYSSVDYIKVSDGPSAAIWFSDARDRDLALKQLDGLKMRFGDAEKLPVRLQILPPGEIDIHQHRGGNDRKLEVELCGFDVSPSNCKQNCGPSSSFGVLKPNSGNFLSQKLTEVQEWTKKEPSSYKTVSANPAVFTLPMHEQFNEMLEQRHEPRTIAEWNLDQRDGQPVGFRGRGRPRRYKNCD